MGESVSLKGEVRDLHVQKIALMALGSSFLIISFLKVEVYAVSDSCKILHGMNMEMCLCSRVFPMNLCPHFRGHL